MRIDAIKVPSILLQDRFSYTDHFRKEELHRQGRTFLRALAKRLGLDPKEYEVRSNKAGIAVSGEITLHAENLYVEVCESAMSRGISMMFRTCKGRRDYTGGPNNFDRLSAWVDPEHQQRKIAQMAAMIESARAQALAESRPQPQPQAAPARPAMRP